MIIAILMVSLNIIVISIISSFQTSHGAMGLFQCKDGYTLHGTNTTKCIYGENHIYANHGHLSRHISKITTCIYGEFHQKLIHPAGCDTQGVREQ